MTYTIVTIGSFLCLVSTAVLIVFFVDMFRRKN